MKITESKEDIQKYFTDEQACIAHCVSADLVMSKGIAVLFKDYFKHVNELLSLKREVGGGVYLDYKTRKIYYLITKAVYNGKPTYQTLRNSLIGMRDDMMKWCGLDKLDWDTVKAIISGVFSGLDVDILVCYI